MRVVFMPPANYHRFGGLKSAPTIMRLLSSDCPAMAASVLAITSP